MTRSRRLPEPTDIIVRKETEPLVAEPKLKTYLNQLLRVLNFSIDDIYSFISTNATAKYTDYSKSFSGNFPTTFTKMDFSSATLVSSTANLFDITNSRISNFNTNSVGYCIVSLTADTSTGTNHWVEFQLRGYDSTGTELFKKRSSTISLVKSTSEDFVRQELEFYFGEDVEYFEVWFRASGTFPYDDPSITVIKL